jgi:hypothetical protein
MVTSTQGTSYRKSFFSNLKISLLILDKLKNIDFIGIQGEICEIEEARVMDSL